MPLTRNETLSAFARLREVEPVQYAEARRALMEQWVWLVEAIANRYIRKLPSASGVDVGDLISAGTFGLADAVDKFDPDRHLLFTTYAQRRIFGAMQDGLRNMDWVPRMVRTRAESIVAIGSIDMPMAEGGKVLRLSETLAAGPSTDARTLESNEHADAALSCLGASQRHIFKLYHAQGMKMKAIGQSMGLSESRVSQLMTHANVTLAAAMQRVNSCLSLVPWEREQALLTFSKSELCIYQQLGGTISPILRHRLAQRHLAMAFNGGQSSRTEGNVSEETSCAVVVEPSENKTAAVRGKKGKGRSVLIDGVPFRSVYAAANELACGDTKLRYQLSVKSSIEINGRKVEYAIRGKGSLDRAEPMRCIDAGVQLSSREIWLLIKSLAKDPRDEEAALKVAIEWMKSAKAAAEHFALVMDGKALIQVEGGRLNVTPV